MENNKQKKVNQLFDWRQNLARLDNIKISGIGIIAYIIMAVILVLAIRMHILPNNMIGAILSLVIMGHIFYYIGSKLPIFRSYLGGGSVFTIVTAAILAASGIIPPSVVKTASGFINKSDFLDLYIVSLIGSSIFQMNRSLILKAAVRFLPVAFLSMAVTFFGVGLVGLLIGEGFSNSVLYVGIPIMSGGVGAGIVPLSGIYAHALGHPAKVILSQLFPAVIFGNLLAIISAGLVSKIFMTSKNNGHGTLLKTKETETKQVTEVSLNYIQIGVGLTMSVAFFVLGVLLNNIVSQVNTYAFVILTIVLIKSLGVLPKYYEDSVIMFGQLVVKNMTHALLTGVGLSLLNMKLLLAALSWQFVVLCVSSIIIISVVSAILGKLFGLYPVEAVITAGLANNSMGGTRNVAVLAASDRMNLIAFAQMGNRIGGALMLVVAGFFVTFL